MLDTRALGARRYVAAVIIALASACAGGVQLAREQMKHPGQELFNGYTKADVGCFSCHNGDASGTWRGPALAEHVAKMPDAALFKIIDDGEGFMPAFKDKLTQQEKEQLVGWLRDQFGGPATPEAIEVEGDDVDAPEHHH